MDAGLDDLTGIGAAELAALVGGVDAIIFSAGSNGGTRDVTTAIDGEGAEKAIQAARIGRQILEVNTGSTPIDEAVRENLRQCGAAFGRSRNICLCRQCYIE